MPTEIRERLSSCHHRQHHRIVVDGIVLLLFFHSFSFVPTSSKLLHDTFFCCATYPVPANKSARPLTREDILRIMADLEEKEDSNAVADDDDDDDTATLPAVATLRTAADANICFIFPLG